MSIRRLNWKLVAAVLVLAVIAALVFGCTQRETTDLASGAGKGAAAGFASGGPVGAIVGGIVGLIGSGAAIMQRRSRNRVLEDVTRGVGAFMDGISPSDFEGKAPDVAANVAIERLRGCLAENYTKATRDDVRRTKAKALSA
jgi:hypothetical protein